MKTTIIFIALFASQSLFAQTVWVADNNLNAPTGPNVFSTIQAAVNAAADGDIVQVQPSITTYGNASINKQLTLMGIGFALDKDIPLSSIMGDIYLRNNSDNTSNANGTIVKGLIFDGIYLAYRGTTPFFTLQNVLIQNCQFRESYSTGGTEYGEVNGFEIRDCYITQQLLWQNVMQGGIIRNNLILGDISFYYNGNTGNNIISNNILYGSIYSRSLAGNTLVLHNNFIGQKGTETAFATKFENCVVSNNIFYGSTPSIATGGTSSAEFENNIFTNNLVYETGNDIMPPTGGLGNTGTGNIVGQSPNFVNVQLLNTWSSGYDFTLQAGSPALGAGSDATDIGISGGTSYPWAEANFNLKTTDAPTIQILNTTTVINPGDNLPVRIKVKSN